MEEGKAAPELRALSITVPPQVVDDVDQKQSDWRGKAQATVILSEQAWADVSSKDLEMREWGRSPSPRILRSFLRFAQDRYRSSG